MAYVNNVKLQEALLASHLAGKVTPECYEMFMHIAQQRVKLMLKYNYDRYHQELTDQCVDKCLRIWPNYSFKRDNAFAYFVTVIDNVIKWFFMQNDVTIVSIDEQEERFKDSD